MTAALVSALLMMGGLGLLIGVALAAASKVFYVYVDPKIEAVEGALPGANCGGCGLPGCSANAEAIVAGKAAPNSCVAAGPEVAEAIAEIMGVRIEATEPDIARPGCYFGVAKADTKYRYNGVDDCRAVALLGGGMKVCTIGCLGLGTCARACPFGAISMGREGLPVVDPQRCTGCGTCERVCPKHIINLSSVTRRIIREYTTDECTTPCQRACPAGIDIREYIRRISLGDYRRAVQVIKERNPFPAVIGRICPRPCELECRRNFVDEPVAINYLKRFAADFEKHTGERTLPYKAPETGRRIAVVGGGAAGLATAFFTARLGHAVTVFEAARKLGGLLRSAIARERLPAEILDWDIAGILEMGVAVELEKKLGSEITIDGLLRDGYEAVFVAAGGWDSRLARGLAGRVEVSLPGTCLLVDFMKVGTGTKPPVSVQSDVVIVGGGKPALAAARRCRELGAATVSILVREDRRRSPFTDADLEGLAVEVLHSTALNRIFGSDDGLAEVELVGLDSGQTRRIVAQTLILAAGRLPELIFQYRRTDGEAGGQSLADPQGWEGLIPYKPPAFKDSVGVFGEGDALSDYSAAIKAIGAGRRAAASLHQTIYGIGPLLTDRVITPRVHLQDVDHVEAVAAAQRQIMPLCSGPQLASCGEVEVGFTESMARREAARCLQCGLICYNHTAASEPLGASPVAG